MEYRKVEVMTSNGWHETAFETIVEGDKIRLFEADGEPVMDKLGRTEFIAKTDAHERYDTMCIITDGEFL